MRGAALQSGSPSGGFTEGPESLFSIRSGEARNLGLPRQNSRFLARPRLRSGRLGMTRQRKMKGFQQSRPVLETALPLPSVGWARDLSDAQSVVGGVAAGIAGDNHMIAWLDRVLFNSFAAQLPGSTPLGGPGDRLLFFAGRFHQNGRMRIAEQELDHSAFYRHCFGRVGRGEGMMRRRVTAKK